MDKLNIPTLPMPISISYASRQSLGDRELQEDSLAVVNISEKRSYSSEMLFVLADGMGGHNAGEEASQIACEHFVSSFRSHKSSKIEERLSSALLAANREIAEEVNHAPDDRCGMGTTLVALYLDGEFARWISVGDSPLLLIRENEIKQINEDHSMAPVIEHFINEGALPPSVRFTHPHRNLLRSAVSGNEIPVVDLSPAPLELWTQDTLITCSDGLMTLDFEVIKDITLQHRQEGAERIADALVDAVKKVNASYQDNTSVIVVNVD